MRLSGRILSMIKRSAKESFGNADLYLFGSRVDDSKRGGDIDIAVDTEMSNVDFKKMKLKFTTLMFKFGFDMKIDIVQYNQTNSLFHSEIRDNKIKLT